MKSVHVAELGVYGFDRHETTILAALVTEDPLLLVGRSGTGKTFLLNTLSEALGLEHRHYNASPISFDDLVGFPYPDEAHTAVRFLETPATVWGAESVLILERPHDGATTGDRRAVGEGFVTPRNDPVCDAVEASHTPFIEQVNSCPQQVTSYVTTVVSALNGARIRISPRPIEPVGMPRARSPALGFSDCLVLEVARKTGHLPLGTFDRGLSRLAGAERL